MHNSFVGYFLFDVISPFEQYGSIEHIMFLDVLISSYSNLSTFIVVVRMHTPLMLVVGILCCCCSFFPVSPMSFPSVHSTFLSIAFT